MKINEKLENLWIYDPINASSVERETRQVFIKDSRIAFIYRQEEEAEAEAVAEERRKYKL